MWGLKNNVSLGEGPKSLTCLFSPASGTAKLQVPGIPNGTLKNTASLISLFPLLRRFQLSIVLPDLRYIGQLCPEYNRVYPHHFLQSYFDIAIGK